jgi:putative tricarboxylic transport membrane protein
MMQSLDYFLIAWTSPYLLFLIAAGTFAGIYIGAIPGLSVTMAVSILISFTFKWPVNDALALISGIFLGGVCVAREVPFCSIFQGHPLQ